MKRGLTRMVAGLGLGLAGATGAPAAEWSQKLCITAFIQGKPTNVEPSVEAATLLKDVAGSIGLAASVTAVPCDIAGKVYAFATDNPLDGIPAGQYVM